MCPPAVVIPCSLPAAAEAFTRLAPRPGVFWLDSSAPASDQSRYSILGCEPRWTFSAREDRWTLAHATGVVARGASGALERLDALLETERIDLPPDGPELPFVGGAVGWLAYDLGRQFEQFASRPTQAERGGRLPATALAAEDGAPADIRLAWYDAAAVYDHVTRQAWLVGCHRERSAGALATLSAALLGPDRPTVPGDAPGRVDLAAGAGAGSADPAVRRTPVVARSNLSAAEYMSRVEAVRDGIAQGEFYQLNLVQRFTCELRESPARTYLRLRALNPAPFAAFLAHEDGAVLCSSPERFLEVSPTGAIRTCPIKGTRPRGVTATEDRAQRNELRASGKERAELLMIVDLLRNDLGRVCVPGSIAVPRLHACESFATVHHLVGEITGQLRAGLTRRELLRAVFPGGSITGAPKVTAMRAIERLEPHRRGIAMGSIGYFSAHGRMDFNIAIRTIVATGRQAHVSVGAGIVWDSDPAAEYAETLAKGRALFDALGAEPA